MKKSLLCFIILLFAFPSLASAHTGLASSNPSEGQVISEPMKQITLEFETSLEDLSTLTLTHEGKEIKPKDIAVQGNKMIANLSDNLKNGEYTIKWKIVGEDGHPITGQIVFDVQVKQDETKSSTNDTKTQVNVNERKSTNQEKVVDHPKEEKKSSLPIGLIAMGVLGVLILVGGIFVWNKK